MVYALQPWGRGFELPQVHPSTYFQELKQKALCPEPMLGTLGRERPRLMVRPLADGLQQVIGPNRFRQCGLGAELFRRA